MTLLACILAAFAAESDLAPRLETLKHHVDRLQAVTVTDDLAAEKESKLHRLREAIERGVSTEDEFNRLYEEIDEVRMWLWDHAKDRPRLSPGTFEDNAEAWTVRTPDLTFTLRKSDLTMTVTSGAATWTFAPSDTNDIRVGDKSIAITSATEKRGREFRTGYGIGVALTYSGFPDAAGFELRLCMLAVGQSLVCEATASEPGTNFRELRWPKAIITDANADYVAVIPHMQGMLLPGNWNQEIRQRDLVNSRTMYMPWWGHLRAGVRGLGAGVCAIIETPDDAGVEYAHTAGGPTVVAPYWVSSLGRFGYQRVIRYVFDEQSNYVTLAKCYRRHVIETGRFVSLQEKALRTPNIHEVIGRPVLHLGALYHFVKESTLRNKERIEANHSLTTFDELERGLVALKESGVNDAYVHLDGWGFYGYDNGHPDVLPPGKEQGGWEGLRSFANTCDSIGYLFAVHDQYRDFYLNAVSFRDDLVAYRLDGSREEHATWCGGPQTILSPRFAPEYVRRNHDLFAANGVKVKGAYLDVFSVVPLEESSHVDHPVTRSDCARYRADCFDLLRARGYVVSSEEPTDFLAPHLDLVHHGPYATAPRIGGGSARGIPVPLWNLVYHESLLLPWEMGDDGGWGIPQGDSGYLHCLLNTGMPYLGLGAAPEQIARVKQAATLNARCATAEMVAHEFLDDTLRVQRATYSDGTTVTVNLNQQTAEIEPPL